MNRIADNFTPMQRDILFWVVRGYSNRYIANVLHISPNTVRSYIVRMYNKIGIPPEMTPRAYLIVKYWSE